MKNESKIKKIIYSLVVIFVIVTAYFLTPVPAIKQILFPLIAVLGLLFLILGCMLAFIARKEEGKLKTLLMLTGISAMAPFISAILHNLFYGLAASFKNLSFLFEFLNVIFFIIAVIAAPLMFIGGTIKVITLFNKKPARKKIRRRR